MMKKPEEKEPVIGGGLTLNQWRAEYDLPSLKEPAPPQSCRHRALGRGQEGQE